MPLQDLVHYYNQRLTEAQGLAEPPLHVVGQQVEGRFDGLRLRTRLEAVRSARTPSKIIGHDAVLVSTPLDGAAAPTDPVFSAVEGDRIVSLDRLCRTIHMLNYLPLSHDEGYVFLPVHPRHVLGVRRNHGAYFEEVIFRCGLQPARVVISMQLTPLYDRQFLMLIEGLKNYRGRGYGTAIQFDADEDFFERYCVQFLYRFTPDFIRFHGSFAANLKRGEEWDVRGTSLTTIVHGLDSNLLIEGVDTEQDAWRARRLRADMVKGLYYEHRNEDASPHASGVGFGKSGRERMSRSGG